jgi:sugar phosphate isomerase/epimerase
VHNLFDRVGEPPGETFATLGPLVRHTHLKDSVPDGSGRRYVPTGQGSIPLREAVQVLVAGGYQGIYCLEWEKRWHPELEEPEVAFPHFARVMTQYLAGAGVSPA